MEPVSFVVYGKPAPAGSKRAFVNPKSGKPIVTDAAKGSRAWKNEVAQVAGRLMQDRQARSWIKGDDITGLMEGALAVTFRFVVVRPKGHYKQDGKSLSAEGRRNPYPAKRPDLLKLARAVEDALTKVVYRDDAQIVDERLVKEWGSPERVEVTVEPAENAEPLPPSENYDLEF